MSEPMLRARAAHAVHHKHAYPRASARDGRHVQRNARPIVAEGEVGTIDRRAGAALAPPRRGRGRRASRR